MSYKITKNKKIAVALSGGVDSTTVALLLLKDGYEVVGITGIMTPKMEQETQKASEMCQKLGIEHHVLDLREKFNKNVVEYFENSYKNGLTPNPCTHCNMFIKWGEIAEYAFKNLGADYYATGHYARNLNFNGIHRLYKGLDDLKDQTYVLFTITQEQLCKTIFPLGDYDKAEVKQIAEEHNLNPKNSKESQDICFICPPETTQSYLIDKFGEQEGEIIDFETGKVLGTHKGAFNFTIGQRKGIGVAASEALYVIKTSPEENKIYVGFKDLLKSKIFETRDIIWQQEEFQTQEEFSAMVKIRYNSPAQEARVFKTGENSVRVEFKQDKFAITPGQAAVFYNMDNEYVLFGGWIK